MNSYILTSKKLRLLIVLFFTSALSVIVGLDMLLEVYASSKTTSKTFITEKESKIKHCRLNKPFNKDAIFIGSSRTFYHISTNEFKKNGMDIYNLGVSNNYLEDYSAFIQAAIKYKPKRIVISLSVDELFKPLSLAKYPRYDDIKSYQSSMDNKYVLLSTFKWVQNLHSLLRYSESIYLNLEKVYTKFNITKESNHLLKKVNRNNKNVYDCSVFSKKYNKYNVGNMKCENGDAMLFGNHLEGLLEIKLLSKPNKYTLKYINYLISKIKNNNIEPIIVFEPICEYYRQYIYNIDILKESINTNIIDLTNLKTSKNIWVDTRHLNNEGRLFYSQYLSQILKKGIANE